MPLVILFTIIVYIDTLIHVDDFLIYISTPELLICISIIYLTFPLLCLMKSQTHQVHSSILLFSLPFSSKGSSSWLPLSKWYIGPSFCLGKFCGNILDFKISLILSHLIYEQYLPLKIYPKYEPFLPLLLLHLWSKIETCLPGFLQFVSLYFHLHPLLYSTFKSVTRVTI